MGDGGSRVDGGTVAGVPGDLRSTGERIEALLDASAVHGRVSRERSEELVRLVTDLYGSGLERLLDIVHECGRLDGAVLDALAADDLVASLLLVHGLHPYGVAERVRRALDGVRPYLGSHGGDVELLGVDDTGVVRLALLGSCDGCPSSAVTLQLAVKDAVEGAAPEVTAIEVVAGGPPAGAAAGSPGSGSRPVIPVSALRVRLQEQEPQAPAEDTTTAWVEVPTAAELAPGQLRGTSVAGLPVVLARVGAQTYAYRDRCGRCGAPVSGAVLERLLGGRSDDAVLRCPACSAHYDVRRAGAGLDDPAEHLEPLPLLLRGGVPVLAVPAGVPA